MATPVRVIDAREVATALSYLWNDLKARAIMARSRAKQSGDLGAHYPQQRWLGKADGLDEARERVEDLVVELERWRSKATQVNRE